MADASEAKNAGVDEDLADLGDVFAGADSGASDAKKPSGGDKTTDFFSNIKPDKASHDDAASNVEQLLEEAKAHHPNKEPTAGETIGSLPDLKPDSVAPPSEDTIPPKKE